MPTIPHPKREVKQDSKDPFIEWFKTMLPDGRGGLQPDYSPTHPWRYGVPLQRCAVCRDRTTMCDACQRWQYCAVCQWEISHLNRLPTTDGRAIHLRCVGKKVKR